MKRGRMAKATSMEAVVGESDPVLSSPIADAVLRGLRAPRKWLPPFLFYDARGSALFEEITELPEYYLTRTERAIFETHADAIVAAARARARADVPSLALEL